MITKTTGRATVRAVGLGALAGLAGAGLLVTKGQSLDFDARYTLGYVAAVAEQFD